MLSGEGNFLASFPGRDHGLKIAGTITSFWYGLAIGLFIAGIIAFQLMKVSLIWQTRNHQQVAGRSSRVTSFPVTQTAP